MTAGRALGYAPVVMTDDISTATADVARAAQERGLRIAAAESVTAGGIATALAAGENASEWFCGSVVAYETATKRAVLGVTAEYLISADCATEMAEGVLALTGADLAVAVTGVGGPDPEEGRPAGTVFICVGESGRTRVFEHAFEGSVEQVVSQSISRAVRHLVDAAGAAG
jgi:nicotinamide-nucleotide amidase